METETPKDNVPAQDSNSATQEIAIPKPKKWLFSNRWYDLGIQVIAIFLSITLSFAVNQCQENRKNKELENFYLKQILTDLQEDIKELNGDVKSYQFLTNGYGFFQNYDWKENKTPDSIRIYSQIFFVETAPNINNLGFETLRSTGKLDIISNKKIITQLMKIYQEQLPSLQSSIEVYLHTRRNMILPYLVDNLELNSQYPQGNYLKLLQKSEFRFRISMGTVSFEILQRYQITHKEYLILQKMIENELKK